MEGKKWSVHVQNPEMLERTRMFMVPEEMAPLVRSWCGLRDGMRILDVGCGTGFFARVLTEGSENVTAVGVDIDETFICYAKELESNKGLPIEFVTGDALHLPFDDRSFDLIVSHAFFTVVPDPEGAMEEMKRVVRPGGKIASVTPMNFFPSLYDGGRYPEDCAWNRELEKLQNKVYLAYGRIEPVEKSTVGLKPRDVPRFFVGQGLKEVSAYPLGDVMSLSNAALSPEDKSRYLELYETSEIKKLDAYMQLPEMREYITEEEAERYRCLVREKCAWYREQPEENAVWAWRGDLRVLITGICE